MSEVDLTTSRVSPVQHLEYQTIGQIDIVLNRVEYDMTQVRG